ncbi:MAG: rRNA maturation RNase YbeY [Bdellovibrionales bacterium]
MIELLFVNESKRPLPRQFMQSWMKAVTCELPAADRKRLSKKKLQMTLAFLNEPRARRLNREYRKRDYATDVLSFAGDGQESLGDLVICPEVLVRQARDHDLSFRAELAYMVLHGLLHLLGYDHEGSKAQARRMLRLQDRIFSKLQRLHSPG